MRFDGIVRTTSAAERQTKHDISKSEMRQTSQMSVLPYFLRVWSLRVAVWLLNVRARAEGEIIVVRSGGEPGFSF